MIVVSEHLIGRGIKAVFNLRQPNEITYQGHIQGVAWDHDGWRFLISTPQKSLHSLWLGHPSCHFELL
jgi:hypothetical protein